MRRSPLGFTLIEVLVAILVLCVGIIPLMGTSAGVTRMIGSGRMATRAAQAASSRMEVLRLAADAARPRCSDPGFASGGPVTSGGMSETWQVPPAGAIRRIRVTITYLTLRGPRAAMLETAVTC